MQTLGPHIILGIPTGFIPLISTGSIFNCFCFSKRHPSGLQPFPGWFPDKGFNATVASVILLLNALYSTLTCEVLKVLMSVFFRPPGSSPPGYSARWDPAQKKSHNQITRLHRLFCFRGTFVRPRWQAAQRRSHGPPIVLQNNHASLLYKTTTMKHTTSIQEVIYLLQWLPSKRFVCKTTANPVLFPVAGIG